MQLSSNTWLILAVSCEIIATGLLRRTHCFTVVSWSLLCVFLYALNHYSFSQALEKENLAVAYAMWCGLGITAQTVFSLVVYHEQMSWFSMLLVGVIGVSCVLLNLQ